MAGNAAGWSRLFDRVHVISLPGATGRRERLAAYLPAQGIAEFEVFDALGPGSAEVDAAFAGGVVQAFPPCFRCGKTDCGERDCNNVLLPAQVGNFLSHLAVWRRIAAEGGTALVVEDDVVFHPWTGAALDWLAGAPGRGEEGFRPGRPRLLRLGWALGPDHVAGPSRLVGEVRMSNPCYAMTAEFARKLVSGFERITTTSDIHLHRRAPAPGEAVTLLPPIASELSWSVGAVASTIHPQIEHADFLMEAGRFAEAEAFRRVVAAHVYHLDWRAMLVLGPVGGPLAETAARLGACGVDVGHEADGRDGVAAWWLAVEDDWPAAAGTALQNRRTLRWGHLVQVVQDPRAAIPVILREDRDWPEARDFRRRHVLARLGLDLGAIGDEVERAAQTLLCWTRIVGDLAPEVWLRVEDGAAGVGACLDRLGIRRAEERAGERAGAAPVGGQPGRAELRTLPAALRAELGAYCERYGYDPRDFAG
jgi:hypothetical protein